MDVACMPRIYSIEGFRPRRQGTSDEGLLKLMADGDKSAIGALFARHGARVYRFAVRITGDSSAAEDVVNDVFLEAWRQADRFEARAQVSTWLLAIARHKAIASTRRRSDEQLDNDVSLAIEDPASSPEDALCDHDRGAVLRRCLARLTPTMREVIDLVYYHHKSVAEVAEIVAAREKTVKTRMFYARKRLAELLAEEGIHTAAAV
jgi:RNA polymerase sigma-70 factor (ECF subfamily)